MGKDFRYCTVIVLLCTALFFGLQKHTYLEVSNDEGQVLLLKALAAGQEFGIVFKHSVALTPVEDWFTNKDGDVLLIRTVYEDFGAGLPYAPEPGQSMSIENGKITISGYTLRIPVLQVRVGRVAQHTLLLPQKSDTNVLNVPRIRLDTLAKPGAALSFSIKTYSLLGVYTQ